ncbi:MAG: hypothetical protein AAGA87_00025 [Pseudomonadota bacterium]
MTDFYRLGREDEAFRAIEEREDFEPALELLKTGGWYSNSRLASVVEERLRGEYRRPKGRPTDLDKPNRMFHAHLAVIDHLQSGLGKDASVENAAEDIGNTVQTVRKWLKEEPPVGHRVMFMLLREKINSEI